jgi:hypothetical protein
MPLAQPRLGLLRCPVSGAALAEVAPPRFEALRLGGLEEAFRLTLNRLTNTAGQRA